MYKQLISASLLIVFTGLHLASSLNCYTCYTPSECDNAKIVTCTNQAAEETSVALERTEVVTGKSYQCVNASVYHNLHTPISMVAGCVFKEADVCGTNSKTKSSRFFYSSKCKTCNTNLCTRNTAGTFGSSLLTLLISVVAVKMFAKA